MKQKWISIVCIVMMLALYGCGSEYQAKTETTLQTPDGSTESGSDTQESASKDVFAMDTYMSVTAYGEKAQAAVDSAVAEIERLDALLSTGNADSEIGQINANGGGILSSDTACLVEKSLELYQETEGAFDIAIYPVMRAWGFTDENYQVPSADTLAGLLKLADVSLIHYDRDASQLSFEKQGVEIDLGGIAKGYTSSRIMDIFREYGIKSGLVNLGGNVQALGTKADGSLWRIAIQNPNSENGYLGVLSTADKAVITSGGYERYFEQDGKIYHHIIDPDTGYPAENGLISVTIVSSDGMLADGLSTSLFIMGKDRAAAYWRAHSKEFDMILMDEEDMIYVSEGIADSFSSDYDIQIIEKDGE